jgi:hypothetical protein
MKPLLRLFTGGSIALALALLLHSTPWLVWQTRLLLADPEAKTIIETDAYLNEAEGKLNSLIPLIYAMPVSREVTFNYILPTVGLAWGQADARCIWAESALRDFVPHKFRYDTWATLRAKFFPSSFQLLDNRIETATDRVWKIKIYTDNQAWQWDHGYPLHITDIPGPPY